MNTEAKFSALKGYIDCQISILNNKVDQFIELLKKAITEIEKCESSSIEILLENIRFLQKEHLSKNELIKSLMETQKIALEAREHHQDHQNNHQKFLKNNKQQQNQHRHSQNQRHQQQLQKEREQQQDGKQQQ